ncbi:MAG: hypothetical protein HOH58_00065 [Opitutaceae bacterium]|nr:hypothetical protein [Opitutaceae bacterium]
MELLNDRPRLPKSPFLITALVLLAVTAFLAATADSPPSTGAIVGIIVCVGAGVALSIAPFLADFARHEKLQVDQRQHALESMARSTSSATEQASIAANGLSEIAETTKQNFRLLDELPEKISAAQESIEREKSSESSPEIDELKAEIKELQKLVKSQSKATTAALENTKAELKEVRSEIKKIVINPPPVVDAAESKPTAKPKKKPARTKKTAPPPPVEDSLFGKVAELESPATPDDASPQTVIDAPEVVAWEEEAPSAEVIADTPPVITSKLDADKITQIHEEPTEIPSAEPSELEQVEETAPDPVQDEVTGEPLVETSPLPATEIAAADADDDTEELLDVPAPDEPALSSDGVTRLTVTAYIGIGNRLFIRGEGPGLSQEEGTPLQFVSIGKWRWETDAATAPVKATLWKNDEEICSALGELDISPGAQMETSANF